MRITDRASLISVIENRSGETFSTNMKLDPDVVLQSTETVLFVDLRLTEDFRRVELDSDSDGDYDIPTGMDRLIGVYNETGLKMKFADPAWRPNYFKWDPNSRKPRYTVLDGKIRHLPNNYGGKLYVSYYNEQSPLINDSDTNRILEKYPLLYMYLATSFIYRDVLNNESAGLERLNYESELAKARLQEYRLR